MTSLSKILEFLLSVRRRLMVWLMSLMAIIVVPLLPLFVEFEKHAGLIKDESYYMTAAVLAAGFGFTSEGYGFRAGYIALFLWCIVADYRPEQAEQAVGAINTVQAISTQSWIFGHAALVAIILTVLLHAIERFAWHVVYDRRFPDYLEKGQ
ncbi:MULTISPECIES: hypothetical protein [unclassified Rhizobium]|uniref:hypothetical protein n=1 Tax=unclassified Rhizobium TaxID=2613769 RepID=UPI001044A085|nr:MULTISPECIES: hypothetical protein [unclassified Rhizobium]MBB3394187.1 hypothetical protein [Rhizobium sp. BK060]